MCVQYSPAISTDRGDCHRPAQRQVRRGGEGVTDRELGDLELPRSHCSHQRLFSEDIEVRIRRKGGGGRQLSCVPIVAFRVVSTPRMRIMPTQPVHTLCFQRAN